MINSSMLFIFVYFAGLMMSSVASIFYSDFLISVFYFGGMFAHNIVCEVKRKKRGGIKSD